MNRAQRAYYDAKAWFFLSPFWWSLQENRYFRVCERLLRRPRQVIKRFGPHLYKGLRQIHHRVVSAAIGRRETFFPAKDVGENLSDVKGERPGYGSCPTTSYVLYARLPLRGEQVDPSGVRDGQG